jgi:hypothetical protein
MQVSEELVDGGVWERNLSMDPVRSGSGVQVAFGDRTRPEPTGEFVVEWQLDQDGRQ